MPHALRNSHRLPPSEAGGALPAALPDVTRLAALEVAFVDDVGLASEINRLRALKLELLVIANTHTVSLHSRRDSTEHWSVACAGEFGSAALKSAKKVGLHLKWATTAQDPVTTDPAILTAVAANAKLLDAWFKRSGEETTGRAGEVTQRIKEELTYLAGWRCQFSGCGTDLRVHAATGTRGCFSYFAHIVAASPTGPRGHPVDSPLLASEPSNFLLLCDACHRLIDKRHPAKYTVDILRKMREDSIAEVKRLLNSLTYQSVEIVAIIGNIAGQPAQFSMDDANEALWGRRLRSVEGKPTRYFNPGGHHHDVHSAVYWGSLFQQMKLDLPVLQQRLNGTNPVADRPRLAIFPMHGTSVLLLAGRVLGDTAGVHIFQPHRNKVGTGSRWAWPIQASEAPPPTDKFCVEGLRAHAPGQLEAVLIVALTSAIEPTRLPANCAAEGKLLLPTLEVSAKTLDRDCIQQPEDLERFGLVVNAAIRTLQDEWRVKTVHLFVSAPASAVVVIGQKLQARHHASVVCHEALPGPGNPYRPTIRITSTHVDVLVADNVPPLCLQP